MTMSCRCPTIVSKSLSSARPALRRRGCARHTMIHPCEFNRVSGRVSARRVRWLSLTCDCACFLCNMTMKPTMRIYCDCSLCRSAAALRASVGTLTAHGRVSKSVRMSGCCCVGGGCAVCPFKHWNTQHKQEEMCASDTSHSADAKRQCSKRISPRRCDDLLLCFPSVSHGWPFSVATSC